MTRSSTGVVSRAKSTRRHGLCTVGCADPDRTETALVRSTRSAHSQSTGEWAHLGFDDARVSRVPGNAGPVSGVSRQRTVSAHVADGHDTVYIASSDDATESGEHPRRLQSRPAPGHQPGAVLAVLCALDLCRAEVWWLARRTSADETVRGIGNERGNVRRTQQRGLPATTAGHWLNGCQLQQAVAVQSGAHGTGTASGQTPRAIRQEAADGR
jgi:hypothetical protein